MIADADLLVRTAAGDAEAFEAFMARHQAAVWRFTRSLTRDPAAAEDALQETFLAAWRHADRFRGGAPALSWLLSIARNAVYRQFRRSPGDPVQVESLTGLGEAAGWGADPGPMAGLLVQDEVGRALAALAMEDREVLLLRDVEGLTGEACAALLGLSLAAVKSRLHRARLRFVAQLRGGRP